MVQLMEIIMAKKRSDYHLETDHQISRFNLTIKRMISEGWELWGATSAIAMHDGEESFPLFAQALVKYE